MYQQLASFLLSLLLLLSGCATGTHPATPMESPAREVETVPKAPFTANTPVAEVMAADPAKRDTGLFFFTDLCGKFFPPPGFTLCPCSSSAPMTKAASPTP